MLRNWTRKLCPLVSLALTFGCGKKINNPGSSSSQIVEPQVPSQLLVISLGGLSKTYKIPRDGLFQLPDKLLVKSGSIAGRTITIKYNYNREEETYDMKCYFTPGPIPEEMPLQKCLDEDGQDMGDVQYVLEQEYQMEKDNEFELQATGAAEPAFQVDAIHFVTKWF